MDPVVRAALLREVAETDDGLWLDAKGDSMGSTIRTGDRIHVRAGGAAGPRPGEVWVVATGGGEIVVHRCVRAEAGRFTFRGDARFRTDPPVGSDRLIGPVTRVDPPRRHLAPPPRPLVWRIRGLPRAAVSSVRRRLPHR